MYRARFAFELTPMGGGQRYALAIGGEASDDRAVLVELYDAAGAGVWHPYTLPPPADLRRGHHAAVQLADGSVLVAGGIRSDGGDPGGLFMDQVLIFRFGDREGEVPDGVD